MGNSHSGTRLPLQLADPGKELLKCAERGDANVVDMIIACNPGFLSHSSVFGGNTIWHKAAKAGRVEVFDAMERALNQAYEATSKDISNSSCSIRRMGSNYLDVIKRVINKPNLKGITPLMLACTGSHTEAVAWLLRHGADAWKHDRVRRHTALHCAAQGGATDAIRLMLASAGDSRHPSNGKTLLEQGNHAGLTALHYAVYCDQLDVLQQLIAHHADITAQAEFPDLDWASVNAGDTVMHIAANRGNIESIQILLRAYNELSGSILPDNGLPRRVRDPRAMRNDYGRLPYHLAMRKSFTWLAELLDPSVPVRYLLAGEQLDTGTDWGPPRLATIAAAVLHKSLVADLKNIRDLEHAESTAATTAANICKVAAASGKAAIQLDMNTILAECSTTWAEQRQEQEQLLQQQLTERPPSQQQRQQQGDPSCHGTVSGDNSASAGSQKRRWSLTGQHRRSLSGGRGSIRAAGSEQGGSRPQSRRSLGSRAHSRRGSRGQGEFGPSPSPLSPRMLMSVVLGTAASGQESQQAGYDADDKGLDKDIDLEVPASPKSGAVSPEPLSVQPAAGTAVRGSVEQQQQQQPEVMSRCNSSSLCSVADDDYQGPFWDEEIMLSLPLMAPHSPGQVLGPANQQRQQQQQQQQHQQIACTSSAAPAEASMLDVLFKQYTWNSCVKPSIHRVCDESMGEDSRTCGVCLDETPTACIVPCNHSMCAGCALDMIERFSLSTAVCPFCRCIIRGFGPVNLATLAATPASAMALPPTTYQQQD